MAASLLVALLALSSALTQLPTRDVWTVDHDRPSDFAVLLDAVEATRPGDTLLVQPGGYEGFVLDKRRRPSPTSSCRAGRPPATPSRWTSTARPAASRCWARRSPWATPRSSASPAASGWRRSTCSWWSPCPCPARTRPPRWPAPCRSRPASRACTSRCRACTRAAPRPRRPAWTSWATRRRW